MALQYLKCEWCDTNATTSIRIPASLRPGITSSLRGICIEHLRGAVTERDQYGTLHLLEKLEVPSVADDFPTREQVASRTAYLEAL